MKKVLSIAILVFIGFQSCNSLKKSSGQFQILKKSKTDKYFIYTAQINSDSTIILLSERKMNCSSKMKISVGSSYDFKIKEIKSIVTKDGLNISLVGGQSLNGIVLSKGDKYPFLIENSCNGMYKKSED